jgi:nucleotide-binding universal stress UspA family protein
MKMVLAAVDNSPAGRPVLETAHVLAAILGARVEAIHVLTNGARNATRAAEVADVPLRVVRGDVVDTLGGAARVREVIALVIGARGSSAGVRALGRTASAVATASSKPVVVVPPDAEICPIRRVLVPLEGSHATVPTAAAIFELVRSTTIDIVALHVVDEHAIPAFTDQPQHEYAAWAHEFLARFLPAGQGRVRLETRVGRAAELVPRVAEQCGCDLIALGWSQELAPVRAPVVRSALEHARRPVLLAPVAVVAPTRARPLSTATR